MNETPNNSFETWLVCKLNSELLRVLYVFQVKSLILNVTSKCSFRFSGLKTALFLAHSEGR